MTKFQNQRSFCPNQLQAIALRHAVRLELMHRHRTDEEAEAFVDTTDLTRYDLSAFKPMRFEFETKAAQVNMPIPRSMLEAAKVEAREKGMPFTRYIRLLLEEDLSRKG